jgi:hypothetical protein
MLLAFGQAAARNESSVPFPLAQALKGRGALIDDTGMPGLAGSGRSCRVVCGCRRADRDLNALPHICDPIRNMEV